MAEENQEEMQEKALENAPPSEEEHSAAEEGAGIALTPEERAMMEKAGVDESDLADLMSEIDNEPKKHPAPGHGDAHTQLSQESLDVDVTNLDLLMDVSLLITVELGRKDMNLGEVLKLGKGSLVELNKIADEPVDIFVNSSKIAEGEVVVVDDHFGVRITRILNVERLRRIG
jgi:flagellar motor switch protein FliN/FliY